MIARIACVQVAARDAEDSEAALAEALEMAAEAASRADLVVLPEATYPGYVLHDAAPLLGRGSGWYEEALGGFAEVARARAVRLDGRDDLTSKPCLRPRGGRHRVSPGGSRPRGWDPRARRGASVGTRRR